MPTTKAAGRSSTKNTGPDAIQLLTSDHKEVKAMFKEFESLKKAEAAEDDSSDEAKFELAQQICTALTIHATIEEEIFYPAVREGIEDMDLMDEADVEHACAKDLIAQIQAASPGDDLFDAKVTVLGEIIDHHVKEEEGEMFPKARKAIDVEAVGAELAARQAQLKSETDMPPPPSQRKGGSDRRSTSRK
jgi:hemerythrin-like domain-containing protein